MAITKTLSVHRQPSFQGWAVLSEPLQGTPDSSHPNDSRSFDPQQDTDPTPLNSPCPHASRTDLRKERGTTGLGRGRTPHIHALEQSERGGHCRAAADMGSILDLRLTQKNVVTPYGPTNPAPGATCPHSPGDPTSQAPHLGSHTLTR